MAVRRIYVFAYDVASDARRYRVAKLLEGRGVRVQESVFEVRGTHEEAVGLASALKRRMRFGDTLRVYPVPNAMLRFCITHGGAPIPESNDFLLF